MSSSHDIAIECAGRLAVLLKQAASRPVAAADAGAADLLRNRGVFLARAVHAHAAPDAPRTTHSLHLDPEQRRNGTVWIAYQRERIGMTLAVTRDSMAVSGDGFDLHVNFADSAGDEFVRVYDTLADQTIDEHTHEEVSLVMIDAMHAAAAGLLDRIVTDSIRTPVDARLDRARQAVRAVEVLTDIHRPGRLWHIALTEDWSGIRLGLVEDRSDGGFHNWDLVAPATGELAALIPDEPLSIANVSHDGTMMRVEIDTTMRGHSIGETEADPVERALVLRRFGTNGDDIAAATDKTMAADA